MLMNKMKEETKDLDEEFPNESIKNESKISP